MKTCETCKYFQPRMYQSGTCLRAGRVHAKMWLTDEKTDFVVHKSFGCVEYEDIPRDDIKENSI